MGERRRQGGKRRPGYSTLCALEGVSTFTWGQRNWQRCHLLGSGAGVLQPPLFHPGQRQGCLKRKTVLFYLISSQEDQEWEPLNSPISESFGPDWYSQMSGVSLPSLQTTTPHQGLSRTTPHHMVPLPCTPRRGPKGSCPFTRYAFVP